MAAWLNGHMRLGSYRQQCLKVVAAAGGAMAEAITVEATLAEEG